MPGSTADGRRHKGKPYSRESRRSGSRNSTPAPSSAGTTVSVAVDRDRHGSSTSKGGSSKDGPTSGPTDAAAGGDLATSAVRPAVKTTAYLRMPLSSLLLPPDSSLEDLLLDRTSAALDITEDASASAEDAAEIPTARHVHAILQSVQQRLFNPTKLLGEVCDRGMRELACRRKERAEQEREREREREHAELEAEERKMKIRKIMKKKEKEDDRPLAVGAHGVARQDGIDLHHGIVVPRLTFYAT